MCSGLSQPMLCPYGADFLVRRELAALGLSQRGVDVSFLFGRKLMRRLFYARELQQNSREFVLHLVGQGGHGFNGPVQASGSCAKHSGLSAF